MRTLILIANSEWAQLIQRENHHFEVIEEREHPQSKEKVEHLVSDRPGRSYSSVSPERHSLNEGEDIIRAEREKFARELAKSCKERYKLHPFNELWIVAGPKFLGELRPFFHKFFAIPIREIHKEIIHREPLEQKIGKIQNWRYENAPRKGNLRKSIQKHLS